MGVVILGRCFNVADAGGVQDCQGIARGGQVTGFQQGDGLTGIGAVGSFTNTDSIEPLPSAFATRRFGKVQE